MIPFGRAVAEQRHKRCVAVVGAQMGKALALATLLPTPSGWTTMGAVQPGDTLFDENGEPCRVTAVSAVMTGRDCYRVEFCDGSSIVADADHRWTVTCRRAKGHAAAVLTLTTAEMIERGVMLSNGSARFSIALAGALDLPDTDLPLSPYLLGVWLGDGNSRAARITIGDADREAMTALIEAEGVSLSLRRDHTAWDAQIGIDGVGPRDPRNVGGILRRMGLLKNKHVPAAYLRGSTAQRMALLQGLMDTDGGLDIATASFSSKHEPLALQVVELAASLGYRPRLTPKTASGQVSWVVRFYAYRDAAPFRLPRKIAACPDRSAEGARPHLNESRFVRSIERVPSVPVKCVAIDTPTHLYLAGPRMVPTHNTDTMLDIIGSRLDQRPVPVLYVGPTRDFVVDQFEPRVMALLDEAPNLAAKVSRGKRNKRTRKIIAGVPLRLAHAGSSAALKSDPAGLALVDEYDELLANVKGQGDPLGLVEARGLTYGGEFTTAVASTPSVATLETEIDPVSGLEFWMDVDPKDITSPIWKLFQEGTRYHWAWPCPHCGTFFIPRFRHLNWPKNATPAQARRSAFLCCPANGCVIEDGQQTREAMNAGGLFVAPGQTIEAGVVTGDPPDSSTWSMWTSGLCSPFVSWGERAESYLLALGSGDQEKVQTAINAGFGECYALGGGGDVPEWHEVKARARPYRQGDRPDDAVAAVSGIDVQKASIYYVKRGFGLRGQSWLLDYGQLYGPTDDDRIWDELWEVLQAEHSGVSLSRAFIDSGFRPDKPGAGSEHRVYAFARKHRQLVRATKGHATQVTPLLQRTIEVTLAGTRAKGSLELIHLNSDFFKSLVHARVKIPDGMPEAWHVPEDVTEDYCRQIVSEARTVSAAGRPVWVRKSRNNHFLDCEAMAAAAAYQLRLHNMNEDTARRFKEALHAMSDPEPEPDPDPEPSAPAVPPPVAPRRQSYLAPRPRGWLG